jgi:hypothetical protein
MAEYLPGNRVTAARVLDLALQILLVGAGERVAVLHVRCAHVSLSAMRIEVAPTVVAPQELSLHAEDGIDDLLLLACHDDKAPGRFAEVPGGWACRNG